MLMVNNQILKWFLGPEMIYCFFFVLRSSSVKCRNTHSWKFCLSCLNDRKLLILLVCLLFRGHILKRLIFFVIRKFVVVSVLIKNRQMSLVHFIFAGLSLALTLSILFPGADSSRWPWLWKRPERTGPRGRGVSSGNSSSTSSF